MGALFVKVTETIGCRSSPEKVGHSELELSFYSLTPSPIYSLLPGYGYNVTSEPPAVTTSILCLLLYPLHHDGVIPLNCGPHQTFPSLSYFCQAERDN